MSELEEDVLAGAFAGASLRGACVMILRGGELGERVAQRVRDCGGDAVVYPLIEVVPSDTPELRAAVERWGQGAYDWVVLTSGNAVRAVASVIGSDEAAASGSGSGPRSRIAVVGPGTATAARAAGLSVDLMLEYDFSTDGLIAALATELGSYDDSEDAVGSAAEPGVTAAERQRVLLPLSNLSDDRLQNWLTTAGHQVDRVTAYETVQIEQDARSRTAFASALAVSDIVLVTSGSAARALAANLNALEADVLPTIAAIGDPTAVTLRDVGLKPQIVASTQTIDGLLDAVAAQINEPNHQ